MFCDLMPLIYFTCDGGEPVTINQCHCWSRWSVNPLDMPQMKKHSKVYLKAWTSKWQCFKSRYCRNIFCLFVLLPRWYLDSPITPRLCYAVEWHVLTNASDGYPSLQDLHCAVHSCLDRGKGADGWHHRLRNAIQAQCGLGDDAQGSLRSHKQICQVVASGGFPKDWWWVRKGIWA